MTPSPIRIRKAGERGHRNRGWLDARFSFSFADYHDPEHMGFRVLRVLNEDVIEPGRGFGPHAHRDMEILTYVLEGALRHRDSTGEEHVLGPNDVQAMSAGTGIVHSEFNASESAKVHSLQIWIQPAAEDLKPAYQQVAVDPEAKRARLHLIAGPREGSGGAVRIQQDAKVYACRLEPGEEVTAPIGAARHVWVQVARGRVALDGSMLEAGDGAAVSHRDEVQLRGADDSEFLLFDLP
jgi:redox-sensitive bicupin YhaK (pirin superfamily)